jgi:hypothetical protein
MRLSSTAIFFTLLSLVSVPSTAPAVLPANDLFSATELLLARQEYASARDLLGRRLAEAPGDNDALYLRVALEQTVLLDYESYLVDGDRFYRLADSTHRILFNRLAGLHGADSLRCVYYLAGIEGGIAVLQGKTGNWIRAFENAGASATRLKAVMKRDSTMNEALLGIGIYHYYLGRSFGWLPFVSGGSEDTGFLEIERSTRLPFPYDFPAKNSLCWILIDRKQYGRADSLAQTGLAEAPRSTFFLQVRCLALFRENRYGEAVGFGQKLAAISEARSPVNWSDLVLSYYVLAGSYDALGRGGEAAAAAAYIIGKAMPAEYRKMPHIKRDMKLIGEILKKDGRGKQPKSNG